MKKKDGTAQNQNGGRPPLPDPTPEQRSQVEAAAGLGYTVSDISTVLGFSEQQLNKHFKEEMRRGVLKADMAVTQNLYKIATGNTPQAVSAAIFWKKVRSRWHEVQRIIHGFDPEIVAGFVKSVVNILRRELPQECPHCHVHLDMPQKISKQLKELSAKMVESLPPSEIVPIPVEHDRVDDGKTG